MINCPLKAAASREAAWIDSDRTWTFQELDALADAFAAELQKRGVGAGDRIAVFHRPTAAFAAFFFAAWRLQAAVCPLNLRLPPAGIDHFLKRLQPKLYVTEFRVRTERSSLPSVDPQIPALFLMTSGSTAEPKIAVLSRYSLLANAAGALDLLDLRAGDRWLLNLPLFHVGGIGILIRCILARAAVVTDARYPDVTHMSSVPTQLYRATPVYKKLRCLLLGGAPIPSIPSDLPIVATYGLTEMGSIVLAKPKPTNEFLGFALPRREARVAEDGEIWVRGECLFQGYWNQDHLTAVDDWFPTRDIGRFHPQDGIAVVGRKDYQFISGGENIQPEEIERLILSLPGVHEAAVIPKPDLEFGARPVAFASGSLTFEALKKNLAEHLPKYKIPIALFLLDELPKKGLKIDRSTLFNFLSDKKFYS